MIKPNDMKVIYNTSDNLYTGNDVREAFFHAFRLGMSDWDGNLHRAYEEWASEYENNQLKPLELEPLAEEVAWATGMDLEHMIYSSSRVLRLAKARMYFCWFAYTYTEYNTEDIAMFIGYKQHASTLHGFDTINEEMKTYKDVETTIGIIKSRLLYRGFELKENDQFRIKGKFKEIIHC